MAATGVAAVAIKGAVASAGDEALRDLWWRFIEAELRLGDACTLEDEASFAARQETKSLVCPWTPLKPGEHWQTTQSENSERHFAFEQVAVDSVICQGEGPWLVKEYQPIAADHPYTDYGSHNYPVRWHPYPEAATAEDAYALATARADKEWRSFNAKRAAISRKHKTRPLEAAVEAANDASRAIRQEIAEAPASSQLAVAIKLAVWAYDNGLSASRVAAAQIEDVALWTIYAAAVTACGYDPLIAVREAMGLSGA